jgi:hypothetical protein
MSDDSPSCYYKIQSNSVPIQKRKTVLIPVPSIGVNSDHSPGNYSAGKMLERNLDETPLHARVVGDDGVSDLIYCYSTIHVQCIIK